MPRISVIMGVYNCGRGSMLQDAVESVIVQSYQDFEFIICDDCSTDGTWSILQRMSAMDKRIRLLRNGRNMGLAATLNRCLGCAEGELIARQDADDVSEPLRFEKQVAFLESNPGYAMAGTAVSYFNDEGVWGRYMLPERPGRKDFLFRVPFIHGSLMVRRSALMDVRGYRTGSLTRRCEDYDLFMRMYAAGYMGYNLQETLYGCREDDAARKRRRLRYRIDEVFVRIDGFRRLGLFPVGVFFVLKPLAVGLVPGRVLSLLKDFVYKRRKRGR